MAKARLFVALELPGDVRDAVVEWQRRELTDPALRPVKPESLHMTLGFLGHQEEADIGRIAEAGVLGVGARALEAQLAAEPVGLPRGRRPRLFALDAPSEGAADLQREVEGRLVEAGFHEAEKRPFWPHLTVARVRAEKGGGGRKPAAVERPPGPVDRTHVWCPTRLVLFRSHLRRSGAEYEPMAALELPTA